MLESLPLETVRESYAEEIRVSAAVRNPRLVRAFATVPRERFLGAGPWEIGTMDPIGGQPVYHPTADANPRHLYHNVTVAIDSARTLNNGHPGSLATWLDALELQPGERAFHFGCGVGYYTAILAEVVGETGKVMAAEVDLEIARRATENLAPYPQVQVVAGDGADVETDPCDAIFINAGVTHPQPRWLDSLREGGRMVLPITFALPPSTMGKGVMLLIQRQAETFSARVISYVGIYSATSARDAQLNAPLMKALSTGALLKVQSLRRDQHESADGCIVHGAGFCFSATPVATPTEAAR